MYKIYIDDTLFFDNALENLQIETGQVTREVNKAGSFKFSIYPDHAYYDLIAELKSIITVYKDGIVEPIFRGRALYPEVDFWKKKTYTCEGQLAFLLDSIARPQELTGTPAQMFAALINAHNAQVEPEKRFTVGNVTVIGASTTIKLDSASTTSDALNKQLIDAYGGYIVPRLSGSVWYLDYIADFTGRSTQAIEFGENLVKFTRKDNYSDIATGIIPYGKENLTVASANGGSDLIVNQTGRSLYGTINTTKTWSDIEDASTLLSTATAYLSDIVNLSLTIDLNAIDLSMLNASIAPLQFGQYAHIISAPHALDDWFLISKQTIDLVNPTKDSISLGRAYRSLTEQSVATVKTIGAVDNRIEGVSASTTAVQNEITIKDTRNTNEAPQWYLTNVGAFKTCKEMKVASSLGISAATGYGCLTTDVVWSDLSAPIQQTFTCAGVLFVRCSTTANAWTAWQQK